MKYIPGAFLEAFGREKKYCTHIICKYTWKILNVYIAWTKNNQTKSICQISLTKPLVGPRQPQHSMFESVLLEMHLVTIRVVGNGEHLTSRVPNQADPLGMPCGGIEIPEVFDPKWIIKYLWLIPYPKPKPYGFSYFWLVSFIWWIRGITSMVQIDLNCIN